METTHKKLLRTKKKDGQEEPRNGTQEQRLQKKQKKRGSKLRKIEWKTLETNCSQHSRSTSSTTTTSTSQHRRPRLTTTQISSSCTGKNSRYPCWKLSSAWIHQLKATKIPFEVSSQETRAPSMTIIGSQRGGNAEGRGEASS